MTSTLMILGAWFAVSAVLCLLLGAVVRRGDEGLDAPGAPPVRAAPTSAPTSAEARVATTPVPVVPAPTTRPVGVVTGGHRG